MSHWVTKKQEVLKNCDKEILNDAFEILGMGLDYNRTSISNTWGKDTCEATIVGTDGRAVPLGIRFENNDLVLVGDFYRTGLNQEKFLDNLAVAYQRAKIVDGIKSTPWDITDENSLSNGGYEFLISQIG